MTDVNILPPNATDLEKSLVGAFLNQIELKNNVIRLLFKPDLCPIEFLPYLASYLSVDFEPYNKADEAQKRQMIAESIDIHRKKGTLGALEKALGAMDYEINVREWYQYSGGIPHTFTIDVITDTTKNDKVSLDLDLIRNVIDTNKNVQSAYLFNLETRSQSIVNAGLKVALKNKTILYGAV
ncbi:phage tail protein I [Thiotrichales bacterium 19X7-9]|nr:phage tail protein I [Thiotrichales bacterium 19X7-9]